MQVGIIQSVEGLNGKKMWRKGEFTLCLSWDIHLLLLLDVSILVLRPLHLDQVDPLAPPVLRFRFGLELYHWLSGASSLQTAGHGTSQLP